MRKRFLSAPLALALALFLALAACEWAPQQRSFAADVGYIQTQQAALLALRSPLVPEAYKPEIRAAEARANAAFETLEAAAMAGRDDAELAGLAAAARQAVLEVEARLAAVSGDSRPVPSTPSVNASSNAQRN